MTYIRGLTAGAWHIWTWNYIAQTSCFRNPFEKSRKLPYCRYPAMLHIMGYQLATLYVTIAFILSGITKYHIDVITKYTIVSHACNQFGSIYGLNGFHPKLQIFLGQAWSLLRGDNIMDVSVTDYGSSWWLFLPMSRLRNQLHEPRIFYPSGYWPETVTNAHVSAHFC